MAKRNETLKKDLTALKPNVKLETAAKIPTPNTVNLCGHAAYKLDDKLKLIALLNTSKVQPQFYKSTSETVKTLKDLIDKIANSDPYFVAQAIVYSRCVGEGMRTINHLAAALLAPHIQGMDWSKRFYSLWNKKEQKGGTIFRPDDISEILGIFKFLTGIAATNAMKKGFSSAIESLDTYSLLKYKNVLIDPINIVHPSPIKSKAVVKLNDTGEIIPTISAIMTGCKVSADTWETSQSEAGQIVAQAVREHKVSTKEAEIILTEAKKENWAGLLNDNKLGILAALRNIRNILAVNSTQDTISKLGALLSNPTKIKEGKIMPYQIDMAIEILISSQYSYEQSHVRFLLEKLHEGYSLSIPNLKELLPGNNLVIIDMSGSMSDRILEPNRKEKFTSSCLQKASLIGMTIAKATNADVIRFGNSAEYAPYNSLTDVFTLAKSIQRNLGGTNLSVAWRLASESNRKYDRVFILSDNECNRGNQYKEYMNYVQNVGNPYVYSIDLAAYGTTILAGEKIRYYYGYGFSMFEDIAKSEFNPNYHLEKIAKIVI